DRAGAWRFVYCRCHAVFDSPHQRSRAFIVYYIDCLPPAVAGGACSDKIMSTTSIAVNRASSRPSILWKTTLILIPFVTLGLLLWLRYVEVNALRQRAVSSYGAVPSFQLVNQNGQPFGSAQLAGKIWIADFIYTTCPEPCPMICTRLVALRR